MQRLTVQHLWRLPVRVTNKESDAINEFPKNTEQYNAVQVRVYLVHLSAAPFPLLLFTQLSMPPGVREEDDSG